MIGKLTDQQIEELLYSHIVGRVGCHANGITYIVPISYAYDGEYIYGHTKEGMKIDIMRQNPAVCFEVDELRDVANWKSVITWGRFEELLWPEEREVALRKLAERILPMLPSQTMHLSPDYPFMPEDVNSIEGVVFRISVRQRTGRFEMNSSTRGTYYN